MAQIPRFDQLVGHSFTYEYAQPDAYHYCQDSIIFPMFVARDLKERGQLLEPGGFRALDVCAGCGVIGLELAHYLPELRNFDFIEIQEAFQEYFAKNLAITGRPRESFRFLAANYSSLLEPQMAERYDLIVANPPYFFPKDGKLSPNEMKNRCRFFVDSDLETLIRGVTNALKRGGSAYLLIKTGEIHGRNSVDDVARWAGATSGSPISSEIVADIRGTPVVRIAKAR